MSKKPISKAAVLPAEYTTPREYIEPKSNCPTDVLQQAITYQDNVDTVNAPDPDEVTMRDEQQRMLQEGRMDPKKRRSKSYGFDETWKMKHASWTSKNASGELVSKKVVQELVKAHPYLNSVRQLIRESQTEKVTYTYNNIMNVKVPRNTPVKVIKRMAKLLEVSDWMILVDVERSKGSKTARHKLEKVYVKKLNEVEKRVRDKNKEFFKERNES
jgi:hypothetical protein